MRIDIDFCYFLAYPASVKILVTVAAQWIKRFAQIFGLISIIVTIVLFFENAGPLGFRRLSRIPEEGICFRIYCTVVT